MDRPYRCMIIDDEEMAIKVIQNHLSKVPDFELISHSTSPVKSIPEIEYLSIEVLFLDIHMPDISGLSLIKILKNPPLIVLTTAHRDYALESYDLDVVDYLLKPIGFQRFLQSLSKLRNHLKIESEEKFEISGNSTSSGKDKSYIFIRTDRSFQKINIEDILHVEAIRNHVKVVCESSSYISLKPLSEFDAELPDYFIRIHRSYIVNPLNIIKFDNHKVINSQAELPIGRTYRDLAINKIKKHLLD